MSQITECCAKCGIKLFDQPYEGMSRKIFRSFATKIVNGGELYYCLHCYEELNKKIFTEDNNDSN